MEHLMLYICMSLARILQNASENRAVKLPLLPVFAENNLLIMSSHHKSYSEVTYSAKIILNIFSAVTIKKHV